MKKNYSFIFIFLSFFTIHSLRAQVVINEYSCANVSNHTDNLGKYEDWIELYNSGTAPVTIGGFHLSDNKNNVTKWVIPAGTVIASNSRLMFYASSKDVVSGSYIHTNFKLTQTGTEEIVLSNSFGAIMDSITIRPTLSNHSRGRTTDGAATWSLFTNPTPNASNTGSVQEYASKPVMNVAPGFYTSTQTVSLTSPDAGVTIRYTTNGTEPTATSTIYTNPLTISGTQVIRAKAFSSSSSVPASFTESNTYFINSPHTLAVVSIYGDQVLNLLNGNGGIEPLTGLEYFDETGQFKTEVLGNTNEHGNDSWAYNQRGVDYISHDQYGYNSGLKHKLFANKSRKEFQRIILKPAANDNYPAEDGAHIRDAFVHTLSQNGKLALDERTSVSCIMYANGQYWGVYEIREKVDDADFTDYYYEQEGKDIQFLKTWGATWDEYGGPQAITDWNNLKAFINNNNMAVQSNYDYVDSLLNVKSLVDYFVLNSYVVCMDWLNWNTAWWRGLNPAGDKKKWRYTLWDMDATFGHYINYTGIPDTDADADPCDPESLNDPGGQGHVDILSKLMDNPGFEQYYISRYIDLTNTVFSCEYMIHVLDSMINVIQPEMPAQITRWGGTMNQWQANVQTLRDFINDRCVAFSGGMVDCYDLTGPFTLIYNVDPPNSGTIKINSIEPASYPYTGSYYGNIDIYQEAQANAGWQFDHWETQTHQLTPDTLTAFTTLNITGTDSIIAHFIQINNPDPDPDPEPEPEPTPTPPATPADTTTQFEMPNIFTPNGDSRNDYFVPAVYKYVSNASMIIFNRWGQKVYETTDLVAGWDGKTGGKAVDTGVYFYMLRYTNHKGENVIRNGHVTLAR